MRRGARHLHPYVERLIGTLRRECLDHVIIFSDRHLHRVMREYANRNLNSEVHDAHRNRSCIVILSFN